MQDWEYDHLRKAQRLSRAVSSTQLQGSIHAEVKGVRLEFEFPDDHPEAWLRYVKRTNLMQEEIGTSIYQGKGSMDVGHVTNTALFYARCYAAFEEEFMRYHPNSLYESVAFFFADEERKVPDVATTTDLLRGTVCDWCGVRGDHFPQDCRSQVLCFDCGAWGHRKEDCRYRRANIPVCEGGQCHTLYERNGVRCGKGQDLAMGKGRAWRAWASQDVFARQSGATCRLQLSYHSDKLIERES